MENTTETTVAETVAPAPVAVATPTAATAASPSFRPVPPQAAMAAAARAAVPQPLATAAATSSSLVSRAATNKRILSVGPDIQLKGEISGCDRVVIEGGVDATMREVHTVEITESGAMKGTAEVEDAEISGTFEGDLVVRGKLTVYASGRVRGNVTYGEIEIQRGGQISGNIRNAADAKAAAVPLAKRAA